MKRRVLSFTIALALCLNLCPVWAFAAGEETEDGLCPHHPPHTDECGYDPENPDASCTFDCQLCPAEDLTDGLPDSVLEDDSEQVQDQPDETGLAALSGSSTDSNWNLTEDATLNKTYEVTAPWTINTKTYTLTGNGSPAIQVTETGELYLEGTVISPNGVGVEVQTGGVLSITDSGTFIKSRSYAVDIASGAEARLSGGKYETLGGEGKTAIRTADGDLAALLEPGCAYFDDNGNLLLPNDAAEARIIVIKQCSDHSGKVYTHTSGTTEHAWACPYCGAEETEPCTFTFDEEGNGTCDFCGNSAAIRIDESDLADLVYDGSIKPEEVEITVTLGDGSGKELVKNTDYKVDYEPRKDAGEIKVTVTGITFNGTFIKTYTVEQDQPGIKWDASTAELDYNSERTSIEDELPHISINIKAPSDADLRSQLKYSYRKAETTEEFTDGLPINAGKYEVKAYILESQNYEAAETNPNLILTINKIPALVTPPAPTKPTYDGSSHELVTAGVAENGAVIEYAQDQNGPYSTEIPSGINAGNYTVWYRVADTENYIGTAETEVPGVEILRKRITPDVTLSEYTYLYDGGFKEPKVTVKDVDHVTELLDTEYEVTYSNNQNVGTATVTVTDKAGGNYELIQAEVTFQITARTQESLSITQKPNTITYGDQFTLSTDGGSGSGDVTWEITSGTDVAAVDEHSGQVTIIGHGTATVKATKSGLYTVTRAADGANYEDATASWTFTAVRKPVTAVVTAEDKSYDGNTNATINAVVEQGVLPGDEITITGLTGTFSDENAGVDKTVTVTVGADGKPVDTTGQPVTITGNHSEHYDVSYSSFTVKATIHKKVVEIQTPPTSASLTYDGTAQALLSAGAATDTTGVQVEYALSEEGPYSTDIPKGINAGNYTVWYRVQETDNHTGLASAQIPVAIAKKPAAPVITLDQDAFDYDGAEKKPVVTLTEADGTTTIPNTEYTVEYSNNINVGTAATVTVTAKADGNYSFTPNPVTKNFTIREEQAKVLTPPEAAGEPLTFNTRAQKLVTAGEAYGGKMVYSVDGGTNYFDQIPTETDAGEYTVYYKVEGDSNHSDSAADSVKVTIAPKTVKDPTIRLLDATGAPLANYTYDGTAKTPAAEVIDGSDIIDPDEYGLVYEDNIDAGKGTVNVVAKTGGNYTVTGSATFVIAKADIVFNPDPYAATITYDGQPHELLVPGTTSGGTVQYALNSATSTYTDAIPTAAKAGNYTVYYKVTGDKNHNDFAVQSVPVTIARKQLTSITIKLSPESFEYDGAVKMPEVTVMDGKTVLPEEEYTLSCAPASPSNADTYTITVGDAAGGNYDLSGVTNNTATFTIGQIPQEELVIEGKPDAVSYGDSFQLTVSGGSTTGALTWNVTGPATVDGSGNVTITDVGEVTVTVEKAGDNNHLPVKAQWTFTAAPKAVTASVVVKNKAYDGNTTAEVASAGITTINGDVVTIDPASITAAFDTPAAGTGKTVALDASKVEVTGAAAKYAVSYPATVTADITKAATTITTNPAGITPLTYDGQPQVLVTAGATNVGFLVYSLDGTNFSPELPTGTDAGTYTVYYKVDGTADYTGVAVNTIPVTVTIAPKSITPEVELSEASYLYDGTKKSPKITVKDGSTVLDEGQYAVAWDNDLTSAGTHTATISEVSGKNYTFSDVTAEVKIVEAEQAALHIIGEPTHVYYGDTIATLSTTGGSGNGTVTWSITAGGTNSSIDPAAGKLTVKDTGSITVKAERTVPNYGAVSDTWTFDVLPKPVTAEVTIASKDYDGTTVIAPGAITAEVDPGDLVDPGDSFTISGLKGAYDDANAGTGKTVTLNDSAMTTTADTAKYTVSIPAAAQADITPRQVDVTVALSGYGLETDVVGTYYYVYDGSEKKPVVTVTATDDNAVLADSDYTVTYTSNRDFGTATVTVKSAAGGNYTFVDKPVHFEIRKSAAALASTPQAKDLTYDGTAQDLVTVGTATGGHIEYSLDNSTYGSSIPQKTYAGTYTVYYMVKGDANHESTAPGQVSVTIKPKEITPKITLIPKRPYEYDGNAHEPTVIVEDGSDTIAASEYSVSYQNNVNAGTATVIISDANGGNYIVNGTATFEIEKASPAFTPPEGKTGLQYSGALQELVKAGVTGDGTVVYSVNGGNYSAAIPTASAVGTYTIDYKIEGDANHSDAVSTTPLTVKIEKNTVNDPVISLSSNQFTYNGSQQQPAITVYDSKGIPIPEHEYTVAITGAKSNNMVDVDTYTVTVTTPGTSNYNITGSNTRTFEIKPAGQETISISGTQAQVRYGDTIQLGVSGGTGSGTVTWTVTDADGNAVNSSISGSGLLTVKDVGVPLTVTVTRSAGGNYTDVSASWEFSAAKKQVSAVVTADDRPYAAGDKSATVKASVPDSELVPGDAITISGVTGTFDDPNVGTGKKVTIDSTGAEVSGTNSENYEIIYPATTTASILAEAAAVNANPTANALIYDASQAQALVTAGTVTGGIMVYSLDGKNFTPSIPTAKDAGTYDVYFKAQGDANHTDSEADSVRVTIDRQSVTPQIELTPPSAKYDGTVKRPEVTLRDSANNVIPAGEYKVTYVSDNNENWTDQGIYTVKVGDITGGNYAVADAAETFTISSTAQNPLEITNKPGLVYYGDTFTLSAVGGSGSNPVTWKVDDESIVKIDANGFVRIIGTGPATITATKPGGANYDTATATYPLNALQKPVTAVAAAEDRPYADGNNSVIVNVSIPASELVSGDAITISGVTGSFEDPNAGTDKKVTINSASAVVSGTNPKNYAITYPATTTASILKADMADPAVTANTLQYSGSARPLVNGGDSNTVYSDARDGVYSAAVPTGTNAGTYSVWYKARGDANHNDSAPRAVTVTITPKTLTPTSVDIILSGSDLQDDGSGNYSYVYDGTEKKPVVTIKDGTVKVPASEYTVTYSNNKNVGTATVTITSNEGGNYTFAEQTVNFAITSATAQLTSSPQAKDLTYTGQAQELVTVGSAEGGHIEYLQDDGTYSSSIPKKTGAGTYIVTYKVKGDGNYADSPDTWTVSVTIKPKELINPKVTVTGAYTYDGTPKEPDAAKINVEDGTTTIPASEYTAAFRDNTAAGTATVIITSVNGSNYIINAEGTFTIGKADAAGTAPTGKTGLPYNGTAQELVTAGSASGGTMVYALSETGEYSPAIPAQTAVSTYTVWYKVQGDSNHNDTEPDSVNASIIVNTVTAPKVQVTPESVTYNGKKQEPVVTVWDDNNLLIDGSEYTVTSSGDMTGVGEYTLTISGKGANYSFSTTAAFEILPADQTPLVITNPREHVYYGDEFPLSTTGGSGTVTWKVEAEAGAPASIDASTGLLKVTGVGLFTVTATSSAPGYADQTATLRIQAEKKPVTAIVTAAAKTYDGVTPATTTVTATLQQSDLVGGDKVVVTLSGSFEDPNAGTDKKVIVDSSNPQFSADSAGQENYAITYPAATAASILKADIDPTNVTAPTAKTNLEYTGLPLALVEAGSSADGIMEYSTDNINYSASLPTGTAAGDYDVWYRVKGDGNHNDLAGIELGTVAIARQQVTAPIVEFDPAGASYDGAVHKPSVTVKDNNRRVIPAEEYTVTYGSTDWKSAGEHEVTITGKTDGSYDITAKTEKFTITPIGQSPLTITNQPGRVQYGDTFTLSAAGGSGTGAVSWKSSDPTVASINSGSGLVTVHKSGSATITATKLTDGNYGETTATWSFSAEKRPATAIVTAKDKEYDTTANAELVITWRDGDLLRGDIDTIKLDGVLSGTFNDANAGNNKTVNISGTAPVSDKYEITFNKTTTASITPKAASVSGSTATELTYDGSKKQLVTGVTATNGTLAYSRDGSYYTLSVPTETNAGTYTVWYKAQADADGNYKDSPAVRVDVTIEPKPVNDPEIELFPATFDYDGTAKKPDVVVKDGSVEIPASEYTVRYSNNIQAGTNAKVEIIDAPGGNYTVSGTAAFTIKSGSAVLTLPPEEKDLTYTGSAQALVRAGTAVNGQVVYSLTGNEGDYSPTIPRKTDADTYEVWYKVKGNDGYADTAADSVTVTIQPKQVTPIVLVGGALNYSTQYTGSALTPGITVSVDGVQLDSSKYLTDYSNNTNPGSATVTVQSSGGNYRFFAVTTFEITKAKAEFLLAPEVKTGLVYTGEAQKLVEPGTSTDGTVVYSLNGGEFYPIIPAGTEVGSYVVMAKVQGGEFYTDSDVKAYRVTISKNVLTADQLNVSLSANSLQYTGNELKPTVTVTDNTGNVISASEYTVTYTNNIAVGTASVTVASTGNNYSFRKTVTFEITGPDQPALTITNKPDTVYYGDTFQLGTTGASGAATWTVESGGAAVQVQGNGQFKITGSGSITIKAEAGGSSDTWTFYAAPKPVNAVVTAASKPYDTKNDAVLTFTVSSGLVSGDTVISGDAAGYFADVNVGTNKTVIITGLTVPDAVSAKYDIKWPATTTADITQAPAKATRAPEKIDSLTYTGLPQKLVAPGEASNGNMAYSLDGVNYSFTIPEGTDAKTYDIWYKVIAADENHKDSTPAQMTGGAAIGVNTDSPTVRCVPGTVPYDGREKTPTVEVRDSNNRVIPESEYTVTLNGSAPAIAVGEYTVTVTDKQGGNYEFASVEGSFEIVAASQNPLTIVDKPSAVYYGDTFRLSAMGGSGSGAIKWSIEGAAASIGDDGTVTVAGTGGFTVEAWREAADGYSVSNKDSVSFFANPKPVTPVVTAENKPYDTTTDATVKAVWKPGDMVGSDSINLDSVSTGTFDNANVGTNKRVMFAVPGDLSGECGNYYITWPDSTTASIEKVDAKIETEPKEIAGLKYNASAQNLVTGGATVNGIGTIVYSLSQNGVYSETIPTGTNAGEYTVWYKVADSVNYTGVDAAVVEVEIAKSNPTISTYPTASGTVGQTLSDIALNGGATNTDGKFAWKDGNITPVSGESYDVIFTPNDTANYKPVTIKIAVTLTPASGGSSSGTPAGKPDTPSTFSTPGTSGTPTRTTVQDGTASTVVSDKDGSDLVREAVENQSRNVVIRPEITDDVTKTEVFIPSSTVSQLSSETDAALTVSSPIADVTISNAALDTLGQAGGTVSVAAERTEQSVVLTLAVDDEIVEEVPGGLTVTVPAEDAGPGAVAVLIHEDGTRETIRKSVAADGVMSIPLSGSATVEIVDNSKDFSDVSSESWAADAVAFASARELFSGTGETTFSPDEAMSRGMLATVLYRLDGSAEQGATDAFRDVSSEAWYAEGVAWAVERGITDGYGDGQFGPDDSVTREQFVVMLWRYAGSPEAGSQDLDFADADQVNSYAQAALCWAVEKGILSGVGGGMLDPKGTATRAQAAQLLKNFMENA